MDMAKLLCAFERTDPARLADAVTEVTAITRREPGLLLAPTTSGSGSEATHFAVVYLDGDKHSIAGPAMYADHVVLDPELARSGSPHQRATSGIDATCQGIESLWAADATPQSRRLARHGLSKVLGAIEQFVDDPSERATRAMCLGSHLVGRAIDISKTTAAHALSYGITKRYGTDHGNAVALTLGHFIEAHSAADPDRLRTSIDPQEHERTMAWIRHQLGAADGRRARSAFVDLVARIGLASSLSEVGLEGPRDREELVAGVNVERLGNNPVDFDRAGLLRILEQAS
jgi:alcohol dehydrogenase